MKQKVILFSYILIIILIATVIFFIGMYINSIKEGFLENANVNIGNYLSSYFYKYALSVIKKEDFSYELEDTIFIRNLPHFIPFNQELYDMFTENEFTKTSLENLQGGRADSMWHTENDEIHNVWIILKSTIHSILDKAFRESGIFISVDRPVLHFRCADTPFEKNPHYHFQRYEFYKKALDKGETQINEKYNSIYILYCNAHRSGEKEKNACNIYLDSLKGYIESIGYSVNVQCGSNIEDFAKLFYAPLVISNGSSFAFMSGFFGKGVFVSTAHQSEMNPDVICENCKEWAIPNYNILHKDVEDYYDTGSTLSLLWK